VALWWCSIGSGALLYLYTYFADVWEGPVPKEVVTVLAYFLVFGGLCLLVRIFYLATLNARRPVHIKINEKVKKKSSLLLDKGLSTIFGELHTGQSPKGEEEYETLEEDAEAGSDLLKAQDWDVRTWLELGRPAEA
ncbi:unnamed protein product, partial [Durusdinium trenchii]